MTSAAQSLQSFATFNASQDAAGNWAQEYILPKDVDQVIGAAFFSGVVFPLSIVPRESVQIGGKVGGLPFYAYIKKNTRVLTSQKSNAQIAQTPIGADGGDSRMVIGLYPIPNSALPVYIWYLQWHPELINPMDEVQIPERFQKAWVSYAVARCKEKESAFDEAAYFDAQHEQGTQEFVEYMITQGQEMTPPMFSNRPIPPYFLRGANTIVVVAQSPGMS